MIEGEDFWGHTGEKEKLMRAHYVRSDAFNPGEGRQPSKASSFNDKLRPFERLFPVLERKRQQYQNEKMWSPVVHSTKNETGPVPRTRFKHASCVDPVRRVVYLLGGRSSNIPLKDFWVMDLDTGIWTSLGCKGAPLNVQEHSMVYWKDCVYVFGGIFAPADECPLWTYTISDNTWSKWQSSKSCAPISRKGHTAVVYEDRMLVYGGYQDMRGSLGELWQFSFDTLSWKMIHGSRATKSSEAIPPGRHSHAAVVFDQGMWIYGGMTDLVERSDLWRLDLVTMRWSSVKCKPLGPGPLHGHSAVRVRSHMLVIGGEKQGNLSDEVWRFHFTTETWERLETRNPRPTARTQLTTIALNGSFFASNDEPIYLEERPSLTGPNIEDSVPTECSTVINAANKSRPLFSRNHGYQPVNRKDEEIDCSNPTAWLTKSSTYSLLSNVSTDSFMSELEDRAQNMVKLDNNVCSSRRPGQARSESVQNFASAARSSIPRSLTTVRFNPFDPNKEISRVQRDETFDITTSDYASEIDEPFPTAFIGISNPVYTEFSSCVADDFLEGEHRSFAQALNPSLFSKNSRTTRLRNDVLNQLHRLHHIVNERRVQNTTFPNASDNNSSDTKHGVNSLAPNEEGWSILLLGGREPVQLTTFDRPLSIWMFRL
ncbi:LOW QUALITY PROTEIN: RING finger protein B [Daphnia magna]|uniref:LOW QUALITY PROTEIN: RING finger protein B n=1 Tax=Daphnia magna TaxID=35525 RepID=UPI001E1BA962|nr:LOW QUALITY PROTEIN: RING finger protein B [Daphnia magna]